MYYLPHCILGPLAVMLWKHFANKPHRSSKCCIPPEPAWTHCRQWLTRCPWRCWSPSRLHCLYQMTRAWRQHMWLACAGSPPMTCPWWAQHLHLVLIPTTAFSQHQPQQHQQHWQQQESRQYLHTNHPCQSPMSQHTLGRVERTQQVKCEQFHTHLRWALPGILDSGELQHQNVRWKHHRQHWWQHQWPTATDAPAPAVPVTTPAVPAPTPPVAAAVPEATAMPDLASPTHGAPDVGTPQQLKNFWNKFKRPSPAPSASPPPASPSPSSVVAEAGGSVRTVPSTSPDTVAPSVPSPLLPDNQLGDSDLYPSSPPAVVADVSTPGAPSPDVVMVHAPEASANATPKQPQMLPPPAPTPVPPANTRSISSRSYTKAAPDAPASCTNTGASCNSTNCKAAPRCSHLLHQHRCQLQHLKLQQTPHQSSPRCSRLLHPQQCQLQHLEHQQTWISTFLQSAPKLQLSVLVTCVSAEDQWVERHLPRSLSSFVQRPKILVWHLCYIF